MGYLLKPIASITEPMLVSLASQKNFFIVDPAAAIEKTPLTITIEVNATPTAPTQNARLIITGSDGEKLRTLEGVTDTKKAEGNSFYLSDNKSETAENIRNALLSDNWFASMFEAEIPVRFENNEPVTANSIVIESKGAGAAYNITVTTPDKTLFAITHTPETGSRNNDAITGEAADTSIELDIYENTGVALGGDPRAATDTGGSRFISLQKTYSGRRLWFELNSLLSKKTTFNLPPAGDNTGWFDTGTINDFRFTAKVKDRNSYPFYHSDVLYVLNGYDYPLAPFNPAPYIFNNERVVALLSNKKNGKHVKGQKEYLNFILADSNKAIDLGEGEYNIGVECRLFDGQNRHITTVNHSDKSAPRKAMKTVNSCEVDLTATLNDHPEATRAELYITRNSIAISEPLTLDILPEWLHRLNQFTFLNRLGGWDTFNADAETTVETKQTPLTFNKTHTPTLRKGDSLESVYRKEVTQSYSVKTAPLNTATRLWLQELVASPAILDSERNYLIIEEVSLPITDNPQPFAMKYRLTEKYNG